MKKIVLIIIVLLNYNVSSQEHKKDTLFITYNKKYIEITEFHKSLGKEYFSIKQTENYQPDDWFYFSKQKTVCNLNPKKTYSIIEILKKANAYYEENKFNDWFIYKYLDKNYSAIFLVDNNKFVQVDINYFTE